MEVVRNLSRGCLRHPTRFYPRTTVDRLGQPCGGLSTKSSLRWFGASELSLWTGAPAHGSTPTRQRFHAGRQTCRRLAPGGDGWTGALHLPIPTSSRACLASIVVMTSRRSRLPLSLTATFSTSTRAAATSPLYDPSDGWAKRPA